MLLSRFASALTICAVHAVGGFIASNGSGADQRGQTPIGKRTMRRSTKGFTMLCGLFLSVLLPVLAIAADQPPSITTAAAASPTVIAAKSTNLSVAATDDGSESALTYTWSYTGPVLVTFDWYNGTNNAKNIRADFWGAGSYTLTVTVKDANNGTTTSSVPVSVPQTPTGLVIGPVSGAVVNPGATKQFSAYAVDQFNTPISPAPTLTWTVPTGGGSVNASGLFTAAAPTGMSTIRVALGSLSADATARVNAAPTVVNAVAASAPVIVGTTAHLSALGTDDTGEQDLTYTWSATGPGSATFTPQSGTRGSAADALFAAAGDYAVTCTIRDYYNLTVTSTTTITATAPANQPPSITTAAAASPAVVAAKSTNLSVTATDDGGESALIYTWSATGPVLVTFDWYNGTNNAKNIRADFWGAGSYTLTVAVKDAAGVITTSSVPVSVPQTPTGLVIGPASGAVVNPGATKQFSAYAVDQFNAPISPAPTLTWTVPVGGGSVNASGLFTAAVPTGMSTIRVALGALSADATARVNAPPTVVNAAAAPAPAISGTTAQFTALGTDDTGEQDLTYTWSATGPGASAFAQQAGTRGAAVDGTFAAPGDYTITCTISDYYGLTVTTGTTITVGQTIAALDVSPHSSALNPTGGAYFTAHVYDQFGHLLVNPPVTWTATNGTINAAGLFIAGTSGTTATVTAAYGGKGDTATIRLNAIPTIAQAVSTTTPTITTTTATFTVQGADDAPVSELLYDWTAYGPAPVSFSPAHSVDGETTIATFTQPGSYTIQANVIDAQCLNVVSTTTVTVVPTLASLVVSPASGATVNPGDTVQYTAAAFDQFQHAVTPAPAVSWAVTSGGGSISASGLYTAALPAGSVTITASGANSSVTQQTMLRVNAAPMVAQAATFTPQGDGVLTNIPLSVLGADDEGEPTLGYQWSVIGDATGVTFSGPTQGGNGAKSEFVSVPVVGTYHLQALISDAHGLTVTSEATLVIAPAIVMQTPVITWDPPAGITYGTPLSATQLSATTGIPGTYTYTPAVGEVLHAGPRTLHVIFTPDDRVHFTQATAALSLTVARATPVITWTTPAAIATGAALSAAQFNASADVLGSFTFSPAAGTILADGNQTLSATFHPDDVEDYADVSAQVVIKVGASGAQLHIASLNIPSYDHQIPFAPLVEVAGSGGAVSYAWQCDGDAVFDRPDAADPHMTFFHAGTYHIWVSVTDGQGVVIVSEASTVVVPAVPTAVSLYKGWQVDPKSWQYVAALYDQFGDALDGEVEWDCLGDGSISADGVYVAQDGGGPALVVATIEGVSAYKAAPPGVPAVRVILTDGLTGDEHVFEGGRDLYFTNDAMVWGRVEVDSGSDIRSIVIRPSDRNSWDAVTMGGVFPLETLVDGMVSLDATVTVGNGEETVVSYADTIDLQIDHVRPSISWYIGAGYGTDIEKSEKIDLKENPDYIAGAIESIMYSDRLQDVLRRREIIRFNGESAERNRELNLADRNEGYFINMDDPAGIELHVTDDSGIQGQAPSIFLTRLVPSYLPEYQKTQGVTEVSKDGQSWVGGISLAGFDALGDGSNSEINLMPNIGTIRVAVADRAGNVAWSPFGGPDGCQLVFATRRRHAQDANNVFFRQESADVLINLDDTVGIPTTSPIRAVSLGPCFLEAKVVAGAALQKLLRTPDRIWILPEPVPFDSSEKQMTLEIQDFCGGSILAQVSLPQTGLDARLVTHPRVAEDWAANFSATGYRAKHGTVNMSAATLADDAHHYLYPEAIYQPWTHELAHLLAQMYLANKRIQRWNDTSFNAPGFEWSPWEMYGEDALLASRWLRENVTGSDSVENCLNDFSGWVDVYAEMLFDVDDVSDSDYSIIYAACTEVENAWVVEVMGLSTLNVRNWPVDPTEEWLDRYADSENVYAPDLSFGFGGMAQSFSVDGGVDPTAAPSVFSVAHALAAGNIVSHQVNLGIAAQASYPVVHVHMDLSSADLAAFHFPWAEYIPSGLWPPPIYIGLKGPSSSVLPWTKQVTDLTLSSSTSSSSSVRVWGGSYVPLAPFRSRGPAGLRFSPVVISLPPSWSTGSVASCRIFDENFSHFSHNADFTPIVRISDLNNLGNGTGLAGNIDQLTLIPTHVLEDESGGIGCRVPLTHDLQGGFHKMAYGYVNSDIAEVAKGNNFWYHNEHLSSIGDSYLNTPPNWVNSIKLDNDIFLPGTTQRIHIMAGFFDQDHPVAEFQSSGDYVHFYSGNGDDVTAPIDSDIDVDGCIQVVRQKMLSDEILELTVNVGSRVSMGLYSVDVKMGTIHAYPDALSQQYAGANGAHRMKDALAVCGLKVKDIDIGQMESAKIEDFITFSAPQLSPDEAKQLMSGWTIQWPAGDHAYLLENNLSEFHAFKTPLQPVTKAVGASLDVVVLGGNVIQEELDANPLPYTGQFYIQTDNLVEKFGIRGILGKIKVRPAVAQLATSYDAVKGFIREPIGLSSLLGRPGQVTFGDAALSVDIRPTPPALTGGNGRFVVRANADLQSDLGKACARILNWDGPASFSVTGDYPGTTIFEVHPLIDGTEAGSICDIPIPVELPIISEPSVLQLETAKQRTQTRLGADANQVEVPTPPTENDAGVVQLTMPTSHDAMAPFSAIITPTASARRMEAIYEQAMFVAGQILPTTGQDTSCIEPFSTTYNSDAVFTFPDSTNDFEVSLGALVSLLTDGRGSSISNVQAKLQQSPPADIWRRYQQCIAPGMFKDRVKRPTDDPLKQELRAIEIRAKTLLQLAAAARLKRYFSLSIDGESPAVTGALNETVLNSDDVYLPTRGRLPMIGDVPGVGIHIPSDTDMRSAILNALHLTGLPNLLQGSPAGADWSYGHPLTEELITHMIGERLDLIDTLYASLTANGQSWSQVVDEWNSVNSDLKPISATLSRNGEGRVVINFRDKDGRLIPWGFSIEQKGWLGMEYAPVYNLNGDVYQVRSIRPIDLRARAIFIAQDEIYRLMLAYNNRAYSQFWVDWNNRDPLSMYAFIAGDALFGVTDAYQAAVGMDLVTGEHLSRGEQAFCAAMTLLMVVPADALVLRVGTLARSGARTLSASTKALYANAVGRVAESEVGKGMAKLSEDAGEGLATQSARKAPEGAATADGAASPLRRPGDFVSIGWQGVKNVFKGTISASETWAFHSGCEKLLTHVATAKGAVLAQAGMFRPLVDAAGRRVLSSAKSLRYLPRNANELIQGFVAQQDLINEIMATYGREVGLAKLERLRQLSCFTGDTPVAIADGTWKTIDSVQVGDLVATRSQFEPDALPAVGRVTEVFRHRVTALQVLRLAGVRGQEPFTTVIHTTDEHPFWRLGDGWVAAGALASGDRVRGLEGDLVVLANEQEQVAEAWVFNLQIDGGNTYFVAGHDGSDGVWVHNVCRISQVLSGYLRAHPELLTGRRVCDVVTDALEKMKKGEALGIPGIIIPGDGAKLGKSLGAAPFADAEAHHLISSEVVTRPGVVKDLFTRIGFDCNHRNNGMWLPGKAGVEGATALTVHAGGHPGYRDALEAVIRDIADAAAADSVNKGDKWAIQKVEELQSVIRKELGKGTPLDMLNDPGGRKAKDLWATAFEGIDL